MRSRLFGRRWRGLMPMSLFTVLIVQLLGMGLAPAAHADKPLGRTQVPPPRTSTVHPAGLGAKKERAQVAARAAAEDKQADRARAEQDVAWPPGGTARVRAGERATAGGLPVTVTATGTGTSSSTASGTATDTATAQVTVLDRAATEAAGVRGVLVSVGPGEGAARPEKVSIDYSGFASAYGGDWSGRLRLATLPACVLTTPDKPECRARTPLPTSNDVSARTVSAALPQAAPATGTVLALTAASGQSTKGNGDYTATELSPSATWTAGSSSGSFGWSYRMAAPPTAGGAVPDLALAYDSGGIDGRTASTNNQGSPIGEGFGLSTDAYIGRNYGNCSEDGHDKVYDLCWKYDNASLVLNGKATELVKDDTTGTWRLANDDASTVAHLTGAANGDDDGEYWTVTTGDGTKYFFGLNKLPGADTERTTSVWTVPVFGDDAGEPGYANGTAFAGRAVTQAWRWNLDYVVDAHGNARSYWYTAEFNSYKKNGATTANATYTRGGRLDKILYGQRSNTLFSVTAPQRIAFSYAERCTADDCSSLTSATAHNWPDVPFDQICASGASDTDCAAVSPAFFTRKRLVQVETSVWSGSGTTYTPVDTWAFTQKYLDPGDIGDSSDQTLVLDTIVHTGKADGSLPLDPVSFTYLMQPNRVDATDDILPLNRPRIASITSETGAITSVTMSSQECVRGSKMPAAEDSDTMSCFPVYWHVNGSLTASLDWFHKYRVLGVRYVDPTGNNEAVQHTYEYSGPAWHYDESPFVPEDERTWSIWRGYGTVTEYTGDNAGNRLKTVTRYMQGMNGDKQKSGTARSVQVTGLSVPGLSVAAVTDSDQYAGFIREKVTYDGGTAISASVTDPWSAKTATQHKSYADIEAYYVRDAKTYDSTYLTAQAKWRTTATAYSYDSYGMPVKADAAGDTAKSGDETCTRTWYARNPDLGISALTSRVRTVGQPCATDDASLSLPANSATRGDVLSDTATVYDSASATGWTAGQTPTKGDATWTGRASGYPAAADSAGDRNPSGWQRTATTGYDGFGRVVSVKDAAGNTTTTAYTMADNGVLSRVRGTDALSHITDTYVDGLRGLAIRSYDAAGKKTETAYDALGRLTGVWLPNRSRGGGESANLTFAYHVERGSAPYTATSKLGPDNSRTTSYQIFDALMRPLQTQSPTPLGGRLLTDTRYDSRGLAYETFAEAYDKTKSPQGAYARLEYGGAPVQHELAFDGAGRTTADVLYVFGVRKWGTSTTYTGDSTATSAPTGGTATRVVTDALASMCWSTTRASARRATSRRSRRSASTRSSWSTWSRWWG
ncbi:hypothetical protein [Nonomuraea sp. NPDC049784]|uniref:hypothetical protein n=1 Tax=Nonomuraea sp. NPDC049784 TaxID=3154361 RepID=UPI0033F82352